MIALRMLNEYVYCPRLFYLEHVQGLFRESADTVEGSWQHAKADRHRAKVKKNAPEEGAESTEEGKGPALFTKNLSLSSERLGIHGRLDAVEGETVHWAPVESKHSGGPSGDAPFHWESWDLSPVAWPNDQIQICAQGLLLRENGLSSDFGYVSYRASRQRVRIDFTPDLIAATLDVVRRASEAERSPIPAPLVDSPKCIRCSLNAFCLPEELNRLAGKIGEPRRIIPGRDDAGVLYVVTQGAQVSKRGESILIQANEEIVDDIPLKDICHAALIGHVQISTEALHLFLASQRTVSFFSAGGRFLGVAAPPIAKNVSLRINQVRAFDSPERSLALAKSVVQAKIDNQRTFLRRNAPSAESALQTLKTISENCVAADSLAMLRGYEGKAGQIYFENLPRLIGRAKEALEGQQSFDELPEATGWDAARQEFFRFDGRVKRPPKDPVNAMLSFGYTLLTRDLVSTLVGVGLDPYFGFYHAMEAGRPALALDLMEPFRPLIVDSMMLRLINTGEIKPGHFQKGALEVQLSKEGRARFIAGYERRMDELVTHPVFGYRISYRRVLDVECRLLGCYLEGEVPEYTPLRTR